MTDRRPAYELEHILTDAALQSWFMNARRNDMADEANGIQIVYGIDANVVRAWGNPNDNASRPYRIGRIFRSDDDTLATAIGCGLLNFIFNALGPDQIPFMIIPPIEVELLGILEALHHSSEPNEHSGANNTVREELRTIMAQVSDTLTSLQLADLNLKLQDLLLDQLGPPFALNRINLLFTRSKIAPIDELRSRLPPDLREILLPSTGLLTQWYEISTAASGTREGGSFTGGWKERLSSIGYWRPELLMDHDAQVLAKIEVWNRTLIEKHIPWRVLYLTADYRLFRAASRYVVPGQNQRSFAETYLRHPHAYLSEEGVLGLVEDNDEQNDQAGTRESVGDWLALLTHPANATPDQLLTSNPLASNAPQAIQDFALSLTEDGKIRGATADHITKEIDNKWREFAKGALVTDPLSGNSLDGLTKDLRRSAEEFARIVEARHAQLEEDRRSYLRDFIRVTTRLGRKFEAKTIKPVIRAVAPVFFEDWRDASEAIAVMSGWSDSDVDNAEYERAVELLERENKTAYAFYLGHAAFFAARGRWKSAALVARRARRIGQKFRSEAGFDENAQGAHGREAAYFEAACERQLARQSGDLVAARICLEEAKKILKIEKRIGTYSEFVEERIQLEDATITYDDYLFKSLVEEVGEPHPAEFRAVADELWQISQPLDRRLSEADPAATHQIGGVIETLIRAERQLLGLIISLSFLPDAREIDLKRAQDALSRVDLRIRNTPASEMGLSEYERVVRSAAHIRERRGRVEQAIRRSFNASIDTIKRSGNLRPFDTPFLSSLEEKALRP
jgi:hypothetical protein